jgi:DNA-binding Xre family transcriptional regulator
MVKQIRTNLTYLRFTHGRLTQKSVSQATGIGQKTLSALETGASKGIEFTTLLKLCAFFNCTPSEVLVIEEESEAVPVSEDSRRRAKELVARGLKTAPKEPVTDSEQIWDEFDAVRARLHKDAGLGPVN